MTTTTKKILFVCGSLNQTTQMHQIALRLPDYHSSFTPFFTDGVLRLAQKAGLLEFSILGEKLRSRAMRYLREHNLPIDFEAREQTYDLVLTCSDLIVPRTLLRSKIVLVQEGMTDPENWIYRLVHRFRFLPRWLCSTAATGISNLYTKFCVASEGYRDLFIKKGAQPDKLIVTGIPNFDNCTQYRKNSFSFKHFVLVCTSDTRETWGHEDRPGFIRQAVQIAQGRQLIFKLHPNEDLARATREINRFAPGALIFQDGSAEEMIANCDVLVTRYSSTVFVGLALGKEVHSAFDVDDLRRLMPLQNGKAAENIAQVCRDILEGDGVEVHEEKKRRKIFRALETPVQPADIEQRKEPLA